MFGIQSWAPLTIMVTGSSITRRGKPHVLFRSSRRAGDAGKNLGYRPSAISAKAAGRNRKKGFSAKYLLPALRLLTRGKVLRGSVLDPFGWMRERRMKRMLRDRYFILVDEIVVHLDGTNLEAAVAVASYPDEIRG
jgi:hypothetical protein